MILCISDNTKGAVFVDQKSRTFRAFRAEDMGTSGTPFEEWLVPLLKRHPGYEDAWKRRTIAEAFCLTCGHYEFDYLGGSLVCGGCGDAYNGEYEGGLLVPSFLAGSYPEDDAEEQSLFGDEEEVEVFEG